MSVAREGGCSCGAVRYRLASDPLFTHCCHCLNCQRQTGSGFAINVLSWIALPDSVPAFEVYYDRHDLWPAASLERLDAIFS